MKRLIINNDKSYTPLIPFISGPVGIGKSQNIKRMINRSGIEFNHNISYWKFFLKT